MSYSKSDIEKWRKAYDQRSKPGFAGTNYFKKRLYSIIILIILMLVITVLLPDNQNTETNIFSFVFMLVFILLIAVVDQLFLGAWLFRKEKGEELIK